MKILKVMADYECHPVWEIDGPKYRNIDPSLLAIPDKLKDSFERWAQTFDKTFNEADPSKSGFVSKTQKEEFDKIGKELALALHECFGKEMSVQYYSSVDGALHSY